ncbi:MAG: 3'-5' exonuclease [Roseburia sp.]|nr:3'-5' exonuclease [Roseburia sp.]
MVADYMVVDLEMTGLHPKRNKILEIGAVKVLGGKVQDTFSHLVNPKVPVSDVITELTGISDEMAKKARPTDEVMEEFLEFAGDLVWVGHNVIYDYSFVKQWAVNHNIPLEKMAVDTLKIARKCMSLPEKKSLDSLCEFYQIPREESHRALSDARATQKLYEMLRREFSQGQEQLFKPIKLEYHGKKQAKATRQQKNYLKELSEYHKILIDMPLEELTRSEASRLADQIIRQHGKIPDDLRHRSGTSRP